MDVLASISEYLPDLPTETAQAAHPAAMVSALPAGTLLVVGAPRGSWFQRQFFGPGARIQSKAPNGAIVVRSAVFLSADEAIDDAAPLIAHYRGDPVPVLDNRGRLVGVAGETDLADRPLLKRDPGDLSAGSGDSQSAST